MALLEQLGGGGGDADGRTTGAKALFCLTAAEKEKTPWEELQLLTAIVGLEGTTGARTHTHTHGQAGQPLSAAAPPVAGSGTAIRWVVFTLILTAVGRVGRRAVEEAGRRGHAEVWHAGVAVAVHAVADRVAVVALLRGGARCVAPRRHAARVPTVSDCKRTSEAQMFDVRAQMFQQWENIAFKFKRV